MRRVIVLLLGLAVAVLGLGLSRSSDEFPAATWPASTPEEQGFDSARLATIVETCSGGRTAMHSLTIVRRGKLVLDVSFHPYQRGDVHDFASVTKSVISTLVGVAIHDGQLRSTDERVRSLLPEYGADDTLRIVDLLTMRPGLSWSNDDEGELGHMTSQGDWVGSVLRRPMACPPGTRYVYCSGGMHVLSAVLSHATGESAADFARHRLFEPLGISRFVWPEDAQHVSHGWGDLHLLPADAARLGMLWLHGGQWNGAALVTPEYLRDALRTLSTTSMGGYGEGFWVNEQASPPRFLANGRGGQRVIVVPSRELVVVTTGGGLVPRDIEDLVLAAMVSDQARPQDPSAQQRLAAAVDAAGRPPATAPVRALPAVAARVNDVVFRLPPNPMTLEFFRFRFDGSAEASTDLKWRDYGTTHPKLGLDGIVRYTAGGRAGLPVGVKGGWESDDVFVLDYDEIANINHYRLRIRFTDRNALCELSEATAPERSDTFAATPVDHWPERVGQH